VPDEITEADARDLDRGFMHENAEGPVVERWFHAYGCRRWTTVQRDTRDDRILDSD
jgi:sarcosine oxidase delta subunit